MIKTLSLTAAAVLAASSAWAHSGHGALVVDGHSHIAETAALVAAAIAFTGCAWLAYRYWRAQ